MLKTNGTPSGLPAASADRETSSGRESTERLSTASLKDVSERGRSLSARSFDPLPEVPTNDNDDDRDDNDEDDDDPYAEVPREDDEKMADSGSDEEENANDASTAKGSLPFPPYGKVSRHGKPATSSKDSEEVDDIDSYAEVRDVMRRGPMPLGQRERSKTQPPNPWEVASPRDKRSQTESATHMPLPDIPAARAAANRPLLVEDNVMYDSIKESQVKKSSLNSQPKLKKERLYESVDEMEKDLYESVPDSLAMGDSPMPPTTLSTPSSTTLKVLSDGQPMPPSSPIPSRNEHSSKKALEKTLSASHTEEKRRFSFFGRKKTASVSSSKPKQPESPTSVLATNSSPQHKSPPPLPNFPAPPTPDEDEEEDTYEKVTITPGLSGPDHFDTFQQGAQDHAKTKSMSLPMSYRAGGGGGGRPNLPLPRLPEDSGSATVQHQRVMEGAGGPDDYDLVKMVPDHIPDEPNYDTVRTQDILLPSKAFDPPYAKIDKKELQEFREREMQSRERLMSSEPDELGKYSDVRREANVDDDHPSQLPDHNEEGYAVVPEEFKMRKRALSASQAAKPLPPDSTATGYRNVRYQDDKRPYDTIIETRSHSIVVSSPSRRNEESQYATVDMAAKHDKKKQELEEALRMQEELRTFSEEPSLSSPIPPPLPPALDPEDLEEFKQPPVPDQSDGMHELVASWELEARPDSGDPPYARVKSKTNPYAEVNRPYAEVDVDLLAGARGSSRPTAAAAEGDMYMMDEPGYDVIGTLGVKTKVIKEDKPYDTIQEVKAEMENISQLEQEMPKLETAGSANIYDTLFPEQDDENQDTKKDTPRSMV